MNKDADWLRLVPREKTPAQVELAEKKRDQERGPYIPHHHRCGIEEARH